MQKLLIAVVCNRSFLGKTDALDNASDWRLRQALGKMRRREVDELIVVIDAPKEEAEAIQKELEQYRVEFLFGPMVQPHFTSLEDIHDHFNARPKCEYLTTVLATWQQKRDLMQKLDQLVNHNFFEQP